jgi:hypothetical protein
MWDDWKLNIVRGIKENKIRKEAGKIANRKCWRLGEEFSDCTLEKGLGREYKCKQIFEKFKACVRWETQVEMEYILIYTL